MNTALIIAGIEAGSALVQSLLQIAAAHNAAASTSDSERAAVLAAIEKLHPANDALASQWRALLPAVAK
jgi:hypothetical protein